MIHHDYLPIHHGASRSFDLSALATHIPSFHTLGEVHRRKKVMVYPKPGQSTWAQAFHEAVYQLGLHSVAAQQAVRSGTPLPERELQALATDLFLCASPNTTPSGKPTYTEFTKEQLDKLFGR